MGVCCGGGGCCGGWEGGLGGWLVRRIWSLGEYRVVRCLPLVACMVVGGGLWLIGGLGDLGDMFGRVC